MAVQFTTEMINGAIATEQQTGVPASITLGQLVLESGYKSPSNLSSLAKNYNNYFGVTAGSSWQGDTIVMSNSKGQDTQTYRVYSSVTEGFLDHAKVLQADRYQKQFQNANSFEDYAYGLQKGGYATDPNYATKLINVIKNNDLTQYDGKTAGTLDNYYAGASEDVLAENTSKNLGWFDGALSTVIVFIVLFAVAVVGVVGFMKAFNISIPNPKKLLKGGKK